MQDVVERIWVWLDDFNLNSVLKFLKDNIVGTVVLVSLLFWIPISCLIAYVDRKRAEKDEEEWEWKRRDELIHPNDRRRIIHMRVPKRPQNSGLGVGGQQSNGVCVPGPGGGQPPLGGTSSQMHHDVVYGTTRSDLHCSSNQ